MSFATADLYDAHEGKVQVAEPMFLSFGKKKQFCGQIVTIKCHEDNTLVGDTLRKENGKGKVLVIDGGGSLRCALVGDLIAAAAIQNVQDWAKASTIKWSPENNTLLVVTDPNKFDGPSTPTMMPTTRVGQIAQQKQAKYATDAIDSINTIFAQIGPILDAEGVSVEDKSKIMKQFVDNLNIDLSSGKKDTFFDWLGKGMETIATNVDNELGKIDPNKGMATQLDFNFNTYNDTVAKLSAASTYNDKVRGKESGGNDNAANPNSSATGRYQIIDSTYNRYAKRLGLTGDKNDPANQEAVMQAYTQDSVDSLQSNNLDVTDGNLYLLHFLGQDAGVNVLEADPSTAISDILPSRVIKANPFLTGMTVADLQSWANKKMK